MIKAVDLKAWPVTVHHRLIPALGRPAMTMAFKTRPSSLLRTAKVARKVAFGVRVKVANAEVTSIRTN